MVVPPIRRGRRPDDGIRDANVSSGRLVGLSISINPSINPFGKRLPSLQSVLYMLDKR
jgi:hypothetical protein